MKYILLFFIYTTTIAFFHVGCARHSSGEDIGFSSDRNAEITEEHLKAIVTNGLAREFVISAFGNPSSRQMKDDGTTIDYYLFYTGDPEASWKQRLSGLQIFYADDRVTKWLPIYSSRTVGTQLKDSQFRILSNHVDSIKFVIVGKPVPGVGLPKNDESRQTSLTVRSLKSIHNNDQSQTLTFELLGEDGGLLWELTETNVGKEMVIEVDKEPIAKMVIATPVGKGKVEIANVPKEKAHALMEALTSLVAPRIEGSE